MLSSRLRDLLAGGTSLVVGLVTADGRPFAARGYGLAIDPADDARARLVVRAGALDPLGFVPGTRPDAAVAITGAVIDSLESVQVKGRLLAVEEGTPGDHDLKDRYTDDFIAAVVRVDRFSREEMERWRPRHVVACEVVLQELFLQTPGPGAGAALGPVAGGRP